MGLFDRKKKDYPKMPAGNYVPVLRCSICTGEQVLCAKDEHGGLHEIMLIKSPMDLEGFCTANGITADQIEKVY
jgi:hypothetical protein